MDAILHEANENLDYQHKKFGQRKRSSETMTPPAPNDIENQSERMGTPHSISSGTSTRSDDTSYTATFVRKVACTSSPLAKRSKLERKTNGDSRCLTSLHNDSGISLTPQSQAQAQSHHAHQHHKYGDIISNASNSESPHSTPRKHYCHEDISVDTPKSTPRTSAPTPAPITPIGAILPKISDQTLRSICKYHGNMVRKFPKKERTPKDQERRNKNTIACRMSRRVKKLENVAIEEQYREFLLEYFDNAETSIRASAYFNELMKLSAVDCEQEMPKSGIMVTHSGDNMQQQRQQVVEEHISSSSSSSSTSQPDSHELLTRKRSYSIAFLTGNDQN